MFNFAISAWQAWAPGIEDFPAWETWARTPYRPDISAAPPNLGFLPPLQRRRLSPLARMAVACAWPLADGRPAMPVVYASHHGETTRSFELLQSLARDEALSPTSFSLSVHNATAGMWSILRKETVESVALSASGDGLESAMAEACLLLDAGHRDALVILAEEAPPAAYRPWIDDVPFSYALALRVSLGDEFQLDLGPPRDSATAAPATTEWPHPLNLLRHLLLGTAAWLHPGRAADWRWRRAS
ncbi:3-oxoacyl-ACP synthase [Bordetella genomosp. 9]|uniref:3-oxoacyl-ACP synthase n=1 Tax=Bordetella genomosp. 9 TaxID=1416803 RepID=A0A261RFU1_9BORD|nr:beta-ketoacyl synthase chain length factor [Bordetella genomosp. 9]OZI23801.1 3-oxoacyl-ACP synthase [Bordetella genomosp. 9]